MSKKPKAGAMATVEGETEKRIVGHHRGLMVDKRVIAPSGSLFKHVGHSTRKGVASIFDQGLVLENVERQNKIQGQIARQINIGAGYASWNNDGRIHIADAKGNLTFVDKSYLTREKQLREEAEKYINEVMEFLVYDDQLAMDCLDIDSASYISDFMPHLAEYTTSKGLVILQELANFDARADYLNAVPQGSKEYVGGIAKLRFMVKNGYMPVMQGDTNTGSITEKDNI
jgi:hypothetical protein